MAKKTTEETPTLDGMPDPPNKAVELVPTRKELEKAFGIVLKCEPLKNILITAAIKSFDKNKCTLLEAVDIIVNRLTARDGIFADQE